MTKKQKEVKEGEGATSAETEPVASHTPPAEAVSETEQAPETNTDSKPQNPVKALRVVSARDFFRRAGILFGTIPVTLNPDELTQEQIDQICNEPMLTAAWVLAD